MADTNGLKLIGLAFAIVTLAVTATAAMEYKAIQFEIIQATIPFCWKWIVFLNATRMWTGIALTRADAVLDAEFESRQRSARHGRLKQ